MRVLIVALLAAISYAQTETIIVSGGGNHGAEDQWNFQCSDSRVITAMEMQEYDATNEYSMMISANCTHFPGIEFGECVSKSTRHQGDVGSVDGAETWNVQCDEGYALVGFYDDDDENLHDIDYIKCCRVLCRNDYTCDETLISDSCPIQEKASWEDSNMLQCPDESILVGVHDTVEDNYKDIKAAKCCDVSFSNNTAKVYGSKDSKTAEYVMGMVGVLLLLAFVIICMFLLEDSDERSFSEFHKDKRKDSEVEVPTPWMFESRKKSPQSTAVEQAEYEAGAPVAV